MVSGKPAQWDAAAGARICCSGSRLWGSWSSATAFKSCSPSFSLSHTVAANSLAVYWFSYLDFCLFPTLSHLPMAPNEGARWGPESLFLSADLMAVRSIFKRAIICIIYKYPACCCFLVQSSEFTDSFFFSCLQPRLLPTNCLNFICHTNT